MSDSAIQLCSGLYITDFAVHDIRFPTSLTADGSDAKNVSADYSSAYVELFTGPKDTPRAQPPSSLPKDTSTEPLQGYGMTFTIGRGNDLCCKAIELLVETLLIGKEVSELFKDMGKTFELMFSDCQMEWLGPSKGVVHLATAAVLNALWDLFAKASNKPLWILISEMSPEELVKIVPFKYITDAISPKEALEIFKEMEVGKKERIEELKRIGYPAYTTSMGWSGYSDQKMARLTREALSQGFTTVKLKVGASLEDDKRRLKLLRSIVDNPKEMPATFKPKDDAERKKALVGKNADASETGVTVMIDANQVWDVQEAIDYVKELAEFHPWFIEEPTAPDDAQGHAAIRKALKPLGVGVATGEHAHSRIMFKNLLQSESLDVVQIDSCRLAGPQEALAVMLMARKYGKLVCPHAGGVGLCEYVPHLSAIDYVCVTGSMERNVLEWVDHLHEHFVYPASIHSTGRYRIPTNGKEGYSIEIKKSSVSDYSFPNGRYWRTGQATIPPPQSK